MTTLHLGVVDIPYTDSKEAVSTGDVASFLEKKYNVLGGYVTLHEQDIADSMASSVSDAIEAMAQGAPPTLDIFGEGMGEIEAGMRTYLEKEEIAELGVAGVPTHAALAGVNKRKKLRRGTRRPSFIDSGEYEDSLKAWVA